MVTKQNDIVNVSLGLVSAGFSTEDDFSVPLLIVERTDTDERVETFSDGDTDWNNWLTTFYAQVGKKGGKPNKIKVGRKLSDANCKQVVTFDADATGGTFTLSLGGVATAAIAYDANVASVKSALEALTAIEEVTVTLNTGAAKAGDKEGFTVEFTGTDAKKDFAQMTVGVGSLTSVTVGTVEKTVFGSAVETWGTAWAAIKAVDEGFYFVFPAGRFSVESELDTLPALIEASTNKTLHVLSASTDAPTSATTDIGKTMFGRFAKTYVYYSADATYPLSIAAISAPICDFFGSANPSYYPLALVTADTLTTAQIGYLVAKRYARCESVNTKTAIMGTSVGATTKQGILSTTGISIKAQWVKDYMQYVLSNALFDLLFANPNVYFDDTWWTAIEGLIYTTIEQKGVNQGLIRRGSAVVTMPDLANYDLTKKASEYLDGIVSDAEGTNPISKISITGVIS